MTINKQYSSVLYALLAALGATGVCRAEDPAPTLDAKVQALEQQVRQLSDAQQSSSIFHLAGYGFAEYSDRQHSENGTFRLGSFSPIFHYQYKDLMMLEAEVEMGYNADGGTDTNLEYAALDLFINDHVILVAGQFLSPIGQFRQNLHPAWINKQSSMPLGFSDGGAIPMSEMGVGLRGGFSIGTRRANYALYVGNGPRLVDNAGELEVETERNNLDQNRNKTIGGRIGFQALPNLEIGLSAAAGKANIPGEDQRDYRVLDADFALQPSSLLELRGEYVRTRVGALAGSAIPDEHTWTAWYLQVSHKFSPSSWEGVVRYGQFEPPDSVQRQKQTALGVNYLFASNVIAKVTYEFNQGKAQTSADQNRLIVQLAYGF